VNTSEPMVEEWLVLYEHGTDSYTFVDVGEAHRLDAAITAYLDSGRTRDQLLSLRMVEGPEYRVAVSAVRAYFHSTPLFRKRMTAHLEFQQEERKIIRAELGLPYKEDDD
jgi:hypothetical protein